ncbi:MAG: hypothetical protein LBS31_06760, partial [Candidatus Adiutrix sp.]|nr:hypothetical protein [Candidatus Adiutrix sp.]
MKNKLLAAIFSLALLFSQTAAAQAPVRTDYQATPFWLDGRTIPNVMLIMERDWKVFYPAYNNLTDLDGDGVIDIGFNPAVTYVGYFDSDSCYTYDGSKFTRAGAAATQTNAQLAALIPDEIKALGKDTDNDSLLDIGVKTPKSAHGVCSRTTATAGGSGQWHGNWLNFATTSRMDAIRKVLYGGKRYVDTA